MGYGYISDSVCLSKIFGTSKINNVNKGENMISELFDWLSILQIILQEVYYYKSCSIQQLF